MAQDLYQLHWASRAAVKTEKYPERPLPEEVPLEETLAALEPTALCHYAAALGMRAKDADEGVREVALAMLRSLKGHVDLSETQSKLDPLELEEYSSAIIASLADFDEDALTGDVDLESRDASSQRLGDTDIGAGSVYEKQLIDLMFPRSF